MESEVLMYNWCHGPECHKSHTLDRVRGVKGSKVLRTRKIAQNEWNANKVWSHFCSQGCWTDFMCAHWAEFINLYPRTECLETPIHDPVKTTHSHEFSWGNHSYTTTEIKPIGVDND